MVSMLLTISVSLLACATATPGGGENDESDGADARQSSADAGSIVVVDAAGPVSSVDAGTGSPQSVNLREPASAEIVNGNSVGCMAAEADVHLENHYLRVLPLSEYGIVGNFTISQVGFGVEIASAGSGGSQPATVNLYATIAGFSAMELLASAPTSVPDLSLAIHALAISATVPAGRSLVVELVTPDGTAAGDVLMVGSNSSAENNPTYVMAADCALDVPLATSGPEINQPQMHWVVEVAGMAE